MHVCLNKVSLDFDVLDINRRSIKHSLISAATGGKIDRSGKKVKVEALKDINLKLEDGDRLGIVGHNGAGKTSLLKLISGIYAPTSGEIDISGQLLATLDLGLGVEPLSTGRENVITRALLIGKSKNFAEENMDEIINVSGLGEFIDFPLKIYSTGMIMRLLFAFTTVLKPDILVMDEIISTGDQSFTAQTETRLQEFTYAPKILILASHDEQAIKKFCNRALLLQQGQLIMQGCVEDVLRYYKQSTLDLPKNKHLGIAF